MTLREQMDRALADYCCGLNPTHDERTSFNAGFQAALALIANPDDEMVERCARALDHPSVFMGGASEQSKRNARAVLKVAGGA